MGEDHDGGSGVGSPDADVVQSPLDAQGDAAGVVDSVASDSFVGRCVGCRDLTSTVLGSAAP